MTILKFRKKFYVSNDVFKIKLDRWARKNKIL
jgi:hypothetical protein